MSRTRRGFASASCISPWAISRRRCARLNRRSRSPPSTSIKYLAYFNAGRALEGLQRIDEAMRAYQRALEIVPDAESATVALTSLQFMRDDREAAVSSIDRVFNRKPGPTDPGRLVGYGSFVRWPRTEICDAGGAADEKGSGTIF